MDYVRRRRGATLVLGVLTGVVSLAACTVGISDRDSNGDRVEGSGEVQVETRSIAEFQGIVLAGEGEVVLGRTSDGQIEIETDGNLLTHIEVEVSDDILTISTESGVDIDPTDGVVYRLGCPALTGATLTGAGTIDLQTCTTTDELALELAGAGTIVAPDVDVAGLRVALPGAGRIEVAGRADRLDVVLAGAAAFDGVDLRAADGTVDSSGVGLASLWVTDTLDLRLGGVGSIEYYGEPDVSQDVTGIGSVEARGAK